MERKVKTQTFNLDLKDHHWLLSLHLTLARCKEYPIHVYFVYTDGTFRHSLIVNQGSERSLLTQHCSYKARPATRHLGPLLLALDPPGKNAHRTK